MLSDPRFKTFVGRDAELRTLETALHEAVSRSGRLVLIGGESGIGKTRLCEEFGAHARGSGAAVLYGRCYESGSSPAFLPWVRVLGAAVRSMEAAELGEALGDTASYVAQLVPAIRRRLPDVAPPYDVYATEGRLGLFDGVVRFLGRLARPHGLVLVLDDLHGADRSSLLLLDLVARQLSGIPVLVLGTYRDTMLTAEHPLTATLAATNDIKGTERLALRGLSAADVGRLVEQRAGLRPPTSLVKGLHDKTEGNPFFLGEYLRVLAAEGRLTPEGFAEGWPGKAPSRVQSVIARSLAPLSEGCKSILRTAAVIGREFGVDVLERAAAGAMEAESRDVGEQLAEALAAAVVTNEPERAGAYRFAHTLIREALYDQLPAAERTRMHRQVGEAIEQSGAANERIAELAYHFCTAGDDEDLDKGVDYARRSGEQAMALLAYEEAVRSYQLALTALGRKASAASRAECELLLALGDAQTKAGEVEDARTVLLRAAAIARRCGWPELLSQAALGYGTDFTESERPGPDPTKTALLEEALRRLPGGVSVVRARLLARLALASIFSPSQARPATLATRAVETAERAGRPEVLAYALHAQRIVAGKPADAATRLADAEQILELSQATGNARLEFQARCWCLHDRLELADTGATGPEVDICIRLADRLRQPVYRFHAALLRVGEPLREGRWSEAQRLIDEACTANPDHFGSQFAWALYRANTCLFRGGSQAVVEFFGAVLERYPNAAVRCGYACYLARLGRRSEAQKHIELIAADDFAGVPFDIWVVAICHLAAACAALGDKERAATLYERLLPCGSLAAVMMTIEAYCGPVAHYLALVATALGHWEAAERHFEQALEMNRRLRAWPWLAETQYEQARMLLGRGDAGDAEHSEQLLGEVLATARALDLPALLLRAQSLRERRNAPVEDGKDRAVAEETRNANPLLATRSESNVVFRELGDHWAVAYAGVELQLKDSKGLRYLAYLVGHPRQAIAALDLAGTVSRAAGMEEERPLAEAGRRERVRSAVTKRIKAEIERIATLHPALGRHLAATVSTGQVCRYEPEGKPVRRRPPAAGESA